MGAVTPVFGDYNLKDLNVPAEAWPIEGHVYKGSKSFTVRSRSGAVPCLYYVTLIDVFTPKVGTPMVMGSANSQLVGQLIINGLRTVRLVKVQSL